MLQRRLFMRAAPLAPPLALTTASLIALIIVSSGVDCGFPDFTPYRILLFSFSLGAVWLAFVLMALIISRLVAMLLAVGLYFAVGLIGLELARMFEPNYDKTAVSVWIPFWVEGILLNVRVLPGSC